MKNQLNRGAKRRLMYIENKHGTILGSDARIGWVTFSKTVRSVYYAGRTFLKANVIGGNFIDEETHESYWISGVKQRGSNAHYAESANIEVDADALDAYRELRGEAAPPPASAVWPTAR